jgi:hypothetical protein
MSENTLNLVGKLEGKLDMVIGNGERMETKLDAIEERLRHVETRSAVGAGVISFVITLLGLGVTFGMRK